MSESPGSARKRSPFVGPRAIRDGEPFFGRDLEGEALRGELLSAGVMLLHAPSGAGKTSLIQAAVVPWCEIDEDLQVCATRKPRFSALRVNRPPPTDVPVANRYVYSLVNGLVGDEVAATDAARMTIDEALNLYARNSDRRQLLVIDQLEEALTLDPDNREGREDLFRQLGNALRSGRRLALLAVRDDYLGALAPYRRLLPNELRATFRLDFLEADAAVQAVQGAAASQGVTFTDTAARMLVEDLRRVRAVRTPAPAVAAPDAGVEGPVEETLYPYVEPVLLQVVCNNLWRILSKRPTEFREITERDLEEVRPYQYALASYYQAAVRKAAAGDAVVERAVRDWIEQRLVSRELTRRPTSSPPKVADPSTVLERLTVRYLVREDRRPGGSFWELSHDLLVEPIVADNHAWRLCNLQTWQVRAEQWQRAERPNELLLRGAELLLARGSAAKLSPGAVERAFLDESHRRDEDETRRRRLDAQVKLFAYRVSTYRLALVCSIALNAVLVLVLVLVFLYFAV
jgi:hypothetical protein